MPAIPMSRVFGNVYMAPPIAGATGGRRYFDPKQRRWIPLQTTPAYGYPPGAGGALSAEYQRAYDEAKTANIQRYQDILGSERPWTSYRKRYEEVMAGLEGAGKQEAADIAEAWRNRESQGLADLTRRGLGGTSALGTMAMGYEREKQADLRRLNERLQQQRLGYMSDLQKEALDFAERRTDTYPDMSQFIALQQGMGQYGGGGARNLLHGGQYMSGPRRTTHEMRTGMIPAPYGLTGYSRYRYPPY